jgi:hypothetical protein
VVINDVNVKAGTAQLDQLPEGISPLQYEMLSTAGLFPPPKKPPPTPWR